MDFCSVVYDENKQFIEWLADQLPLPMLKRWLVIWLVVFLIGLAAFLR